jgi:hypothetical protein
MSGAALARHLGITRQAVSKKAVRGELAVATLPDGTYDPDKAADLFSASPAVRAAAVGARRRTEADDDDASFAAARRRREHANAALAELELAEARRRLVDVDSAGRAFEERTRRLRDRLLLVARDVAPDLVRLTDEHAIAARVTQALKVALIEAADDATRRPD